MTQAKCPCLNYTAMNVDPSLQPKTNSWQPQRAEQEPDHCRCIDAECMRTYLNCNMMSFRFYNNKTRSDSEADKGTQSTTSRTSYLGPSGYLYHFEVHLRYMIL